MCAINILVKYAFHFAAYTCTGTWIEIRTWSPANTPVVVNSKSLSSDCNSSAFICSWLPTNLNIVLIDKVPSNNHKRNTGHDLPTPRIRPR